MEKNAKPLQMPKRPVNVNDPASLKIQLDALTTQYHRGGHLSSDPLFWVHQYRDVRDQEAVAIFAAQLAYGRVEQVHQAVRSALGRMEGLAGSPFAFLQKLSDPAFRRRAERSFEDYIYRFQRGADLVELGSILGQSIERHGSIGAHFLSHLNAEDTQVGPALSAFVADLREFTVRPLSYGLRYFLSTPADQSACKRWCMLLRWMGRIENPRVLDLGLWAQPNVLTQGIAASRRLQARQLVIPLDTHTGRISGYLGLTERKTLSWAAALEVTERLKTLDPLDPTRYDFAIARLGILDQCQKRYRPQICRSCLLQTVCRYRSPAAGPTGRSSPTPS